MRLLKSAFCNIILAIQSERTRHLSNFYLVNNVDLTVPDSAAEGRGIIVITDECDRQNG